MIRRNTLARSATATLALSTAAMLALTGCGVGVQSGGANGDTVAVEELPSRDDVGNSSPQRINVEHTGQPHDKRDVVRTGRGVEPVDEPQALLSERQR